MSWRKSVWKRTTAMGSKAGGISWGFCQLNSNNMVAAKSQLTAAKALMEEGP